MFGVRLVFFFKQKTAYELRISDWSSDVCSSDLPAVSDLDEASLARWMARAVPDFQGLGRIGKFPGGQSNPTYRIEAGERTYVLRRQPFGDLQIGRASCRERVCQYV